MANVGELICTLRHGRDELATDEERRTKRTGRCYLCGRAGDVRREILGSTSRRSDGYYHKNISRHAMPSGEKEILDANSPSHMGTRADAVPTRLNSGRLSVLRRRLSSNLNSRHSDLLFLSQFHNTYKKTPPSRPSTACKNTHSNRHDLT
jgi:hypothetical protein